MKYYVVYNNIDKTFFDVPIKDINIAKKYCTYLSNRDNLIYDIKERYMLIGIVDYKDKEVMEALNNV